MTDCKNCEFFEEKDNKGKQASPLMYCAKYRKALRVCKNNNGEKIVFKDKNCKEC